MIFCVSNKMLKNRQYSETFCVICVICVKFNIEIKLIKKTDFNIFRVKNGKLSVLSE